ncbi:MAG: alpha-D-ribose 1-methylphosphonate 5-triphosphate diphosphatase [Spirochaetaceae bacterium]|jgi:alpha-D-ribose 1-methylphosphonate 5-triphosphate diphosphatase|nr:alpha-D-ribose 1-methylphosphonate 5-triphosphate diphosphatase [Spirochaetaceae bacterium]
MNKCILNAVVVGPDKILPNHAVIIRKDRILAVLPMGSLRRRDQNGSGMRCFDARGGYVMPGFIDIHSDYIEGILQPRPAALMDFELGLREAEKQLLGHGVTTIYHSLSIMNVAGSKGGRTSFRSRENFERLALLIQDFHQGYHLIRHRLHARYDIYTADLYDYVTRILEEGKVHELSFMDHTPGQGQYRDFEIYARSTAGWDVEGDLPLEEKLAILRNRSGVSRKKLKSLAALAKKQGIPLASHDDDSPEKVLFMKNEYGTKISEFPVELAAAKKARDEGLMVVMGAPNVMIGGSHSGNLSALEAIREGCTDILCSDYYPASLLHSAFMLEEKGIIPLAEAVRMLTFNPAKAVGIAADYGLVEEGKKADLLIVRKLQGRPLVYRCFIDGQSVLRYKYRQG